MSEPYIGEIKLFPYPRGAPDGWQLCDGTLLSIAENDVLYSLLGTTYGGDGQTTFAVPDLRGAVPIHQGTGPGLSTYAIGQKSGTESVTLLSTQMPAHNHFLLASQTPADSETPTGQILAQAPAGSGQYLASPGSATLAPLGPVVQVAGGSQPHDNCMPTLALNPCIAVVGIYPSQN